MCAKKIRRELQEDRAQIKPMVGVKKVAALSDIEVTLTSLLSMLGKTEFTVTKGAGYHRNDCELDIEDEAEEAVEDQKKSQLSILDRTEELETEDTIVQQPRPETVTSSDEDATMETVSTDGMPVTPTNQKSTVLASTVQKSNAHKARRMSPILSPISKGNYLDPWSSPDCCPDPSEIS